MSERSKLAIQARYGLSLCLLLRVKRQLKELYGLDDKKCTAYASVTGAAAFAKEKASACRVLVAIDDTLPLPSTAADVGQWDIITQQYHLVLTPC